MLSIYIFLKSYPRSCIFRNEERKLLNLVQTLIYIYLYVNQSRPNTISFKICNKDGFDTCIILVQF